MSKENTPRRWKLTTAILSLSLLTVMAGAAVAPALSLIQDYFKNVDSMFVQLIISMPALFIAITNAFFPKLAARFKARTLVIMGLLLYVIFGCGAGLFTNIILILICRALVGVGVGIIMPLSTGLISFYYTKDKQDRLMGMSSAMNMMGGVVATLIAGLLAQISWQHAFMVYLMGLISIILCAMWMPNESIAPGDSDSSGRQKETAQESSFKKYYAYIIAIFLVMLTFFIYPADFAMESARMHLVPEKFVAAVMASGDIFGFFGGLAYAGMRKHLKGATRFAAPVLFFIGYLILTTVTNFGGAVAGSWFIGFANGVGIPFIISSASIKAGKNAASTVMPLLSISMYLSQFLAPFILSGLEKLMGTFIPGFHSFQAAMITAALLFFWSFTIKGSAQLPQKPQIHQEKHQKH